MKRVASNAMPAVTPSVDGIIIITNRYRKKVEAKFDLSLPFSIF